MFFREFDEHFIISLFKASQCNFDLLFRYPVSLEDRFKLGRDLMFPLLVTKALVFNVPYELVELSPIR
jgi:hypothetical protein